jgi:biotin carboxylase
LSAERFGKKKNEKSADGELERHFRNSHSATIFLEKMHSEILDRGKLLFLGAGTWQTPYLKKAKAMDLQLFVCDWLENPSGKQYADVFEPIDLKEKEEVLKFARRNQVEAVLTSADIGVLTAAYVASRMQLRFHSEEVALNASNKFNMRMRAQKCGISIPRFEAALTLEEAREAVDRIGFPVIIKPTDNCSSRGVRVIFNHRELTSMFEDTIQYSVERRVLIEELLTGTEGSAEALIVAGKIHVLGICDKKKSEMPFRFDLQLNYPGNYTDRQYNRIVELLNQIVTGYEIVNGIIHVEFIVNQENVSLIEFALRGCGSNVITHLIPAMTGFDPVPYLIQMAFGRMDSIQLKRDQAGILKFIMLHPGNIKEIVGVETARKCEGIVDFEIEKKAGDRIDIVKNGRERPGFCLAVGRNHEEAELFVREAMSHIKVRYTTNG